MNAITLRSPEDCRPRVDDRGCRTLRVARGFFKKIRERRPSEGDQKSPAAFLKCR